MSVLILGGSRLLPGVMLMSEGHTAMGLMPVQVACITPGTMMISQSRLLSRSLSGSVVLPQPGSVWILMAHIATKGHIDAWDLNCNL